MTLQVYLTIIGRCWPRAVRMPYPVLQALPGVSGQPILSIRRILRRKVCSDDRQEDSRHESDGRNQDQLGRHRNRRRFHVTTGQFNLRTIFVSRKL